MNKKLLKYYQKYGAIYVAEHDKNSKTEFYIWAFSGFFILFLGSLFLFFVYQEIFNNYDWKLISFGLFIILLYPFLIFLQNSIKIIVTPDSVILIKPFKTRSFLIKNLKQIRGKKTLSFFCNDGTIYQDNSLIDYNIEKLLDCLRQINPDIRYSEKHIDTEYLDVK